MNKKQYSKEVVGEQYHWYFFPSSFHIMSLFGDRRIGLQQVERKFSLLQTMHSDVKPERRKPKASEVEEWMSVSRARRAPCQPVGFSLRFGSSSVDPEKTGRNQPDAMPTSKTSKIPQTQMFKYFKYFKYCTLFLVDKLISKTIWGYLIRGRTCCFQNNVTSKFPRCSGSSLAHSRKKARRPPQQDIAWCDKSKSFISWWKSRYKQKQIWYYERRVEVELPLTCLACLKPRLMAQRFRHLLALKIALNSKHHTHSHATESMNPSLVLACDKHYTSVYVIFNPIHSRIRTVKLRNEESWSA